MNYLMNLFPYLHGYLGFGNLIAHKREKEMYFGQISRMEADELRFAKVRNSSQNYCSHEMAFILKVAYIITVLFSTQQPLCFLQYCATNNVGSL